MPTASAACDSTPSSVSPALLRPPRPVTAAAMASATRITAGNSGTAKASDSATPSSAACAVASP